MNWVYNEVGPTYIFLVPTGSYRTRERKNKSELPRNYIHTVSIVLCGNSPLPNSCQLQLLLPSLYNPAQHAPLASVPHPSVMPTASPWMLHLATPSFSSPCLPHSVVESPLFDSSKLCLTCLPSSSSANPSTVTSSPARTSVHSCAPFNALCLLFPPICFTGWACELPCELCITTPLIAVHMHDYDE